jgi:phosphatidylserine decarboxylase
MSDERKNEKYRKLFKGNARRAFMGKDQQGNFSVKLMDSKGKERIRMVVDENDEPRMKFINEKGEVIYKLPPEV